MEPLQLPKRNNPEFHVRAAVIRMLESRKWYVKICHSSMYSSGFPDLYCTHLKHGPRWVEVKLPNMQGSRFTAAQLKEFPLLSANGTPIWILTGATESEYKKLFMPENLMEYLIMKM